jgi:hypothetical protein
MLDSEQPGRIVDGTVAIVVVADCAIEEMIAKNSIEGFELSRTGLWGSCRHIHAGQCGDATCSDEPTVNFDHTRIAGLNRPKLRVVTDLREFSAGAVDRIDEPFAVLNLLLPLIDRNSRHRMFSWSCMRDTFIPKLFVRHMEEQA